MLICTMDHKDPQITFGNGGSHTIGDNNACIEELERINKEIEAVKSEVEKEQKRLSQYQTSQSLVQSESPDLCSEKYFRSTNSKAKDHNGNHLKYRNTGSSNSSRKYVLDRARPKTDLEYDPCSNFSADLLSSTSIESKQKSTDLDTRRSLTNNQKGKKVINQSTLSDDSDDQVLTIDIPSVNHTMDKNRQESKNNTKPSAFPERNLPVKNQVNKTKPCQHMETNSDHQNFEVKQPEYKRENEKTPAKLVSVTQEPESSEGELIIDVSPQEEHKQQKTCGTNSTQLRNKLPSAPIISTLPEYVISRKPPIKQTKPLLEDIQEEPVTEETTITNFSLESFIENQEKDQNDGNVMDDISMCLSNMRSESEKIKCIQEVRMLKGNSFEGDQHVYSQPTAYRQNATLEIEQQIKTSSHSSASGLSKKISQDQVHQQNISMVSSRPIPSSLKIEEQVCGPLNITKTSPATSQNIHVEPLYISASDPGIISAFSTNQPNPKPAVQSVQKQQSDASFPVPTDTTPSKSFALANMAGNNAETIVINSSSDEDLRYSELDLSETDPMEECYRIFMEANQNEASAEPCDQSEEGMESQTTGLKSSAALLKKRVAHVAKFEASSKSKAQIIVPLHEGSALSASSRTQICQRRATILTSAVKGCQPQVLNSAPRRPYTHNIIHSSTMQNSCVNIIPVGTTLQLGSNVHLIVPEGNCAVPLTLLPTTMSVHRQTQPPPQVQISHPPQPPNYIQTVSHPPPPPNYIQAVSYPPQPPNYIQAVSHPPQPPNYIPAKAMGVKRKAKIRQDTGAKVPHDVRQRYVNLFVEEFLKSSVTVQDAFEKALAEEKTVYDRSINKLKYLSIAVNALKRLKNQNVLPAKGSSERDQHVSRGNVRLNTSALQGPDEATLYEQLKEHILSEELLRVNNFPRKHPDNGDFAIQFGETKKGVNDSLKRICCRCGATFSVDKSGKHTRHEECNYHYGKVIENRVPGGVETRYSCCENAVGSPGCQVFNVYRSLNYNCTCALKELHVHDAVSLQGFVSSRSLSAKGKACPGLFAVDTQTCYTTQGLELVRVTVVNSRLQVVFDVFVKPEKDVIDYNTRFSGISEADVKSSCSSLRDVHDVLLSFIKEDTILIGHGLENDLAALKIIHNTVVDTSVVFPHRLGLPHKRDLNSLTADYLRRIIQESVVGHDTREDATASMELMLWRVKEDSKVKRW